MKKDKLPSIVSILILTLMTVILWITLSIYHAFTTKPAASVPTEISAPLEPSWTKILLNRLRVAYI